MCGDRAYIRNLCTFFSIVGKPKIALKNKILKTNKCSEKTT